VVDDTLNSADTVLGPSGSEDSELPAGTMLGDYRIVERIGAGGMGAVYRAEHVLMADKEYAVKVVAERLAHDSGFLARFVDEGRAMADLQHPHIVSVHNVGRAKSSGRYFMAMDLVPGPDGAPRDLHAELEDRDGGRLPQPVALKWLTQIADALRCAHDQGIVHRDIKPSNILLDERGDVRLTDFGLAKAIGNETLLSQIHQTTQQTLNSARTLQPHERSPHGSSSSSVLGTYDYMAPEQRAGGTIDARTDIYAFGVLMYRVLTGKRPTFGSLPPSKVVPGLSRKWDAVVACCMQDDPAARYSSAKELLADLKAIAPSGARRSPLCVAAGGLAIVCMTCAALWLAGLLAVDVREPAPDKAVTDGGLPQSSPETFNSRLNLRVFASPPIGFLGWTEPVLLGLTPSVEPVPVPSEEGWYVEPVDKVDISELAAEMKAAAIPGLRLKDAADADLAHLRGASALKTLDLEGTAITDAGLAHLKGLTALESLQLAHAAITDVGLVYLKGLTALERLDLRGTAITDARLVHLKGLTALEELDLSRNGGITDAGLAHLKGLTALKTLDLEGAAITDAGLAHLKGLTALESLQLAHAAITDVGLVHLKGLTALESLDLRGTAITDVGLAQLKGLTALEGLGLGRTAITDAGLAHLDDLTALESLSLGPNKKITGVGLVHLTGLTALRYLDLAGTAITDAALVHLKGLTALKELRLPKGGLTDVGLAYLEGLTALESLHLGDAAITDVGLVHLKGLTALEGLYLQNTKITDVGLAHLQGLTALEGLSLGPNKKITGVGLVHLKGLTALRYLSLKGTATTDAALAHLKGLTALRSLNLEGTAITDAALAHLKGLTALKTFHLHGTKITGVGFMHLKGLAALEILGLSNTKITDAGLAHLKSLTALVMLRLDDTAITDAGLAHLKGLAALQELHLDNTAITDAGLAHLKGLAALAWLGLDDTETTEAARAALQKALPNTRIGF
jgi:Leucine-rich repeat (LRR) protein/tRNA A-37 threonylcarbamoyl transferase component Bud32